ncbi:hypothetical protein [Streptomyces sp. NPDC048737]|uniref:hypothetical protein n=1 Tax=unclassified Streptomyces TaxID=2593676 RepID=UPI0034398088
MELVGRLMEQARSQGLELTGEGGLLQQLTKVFLESAPEGELTAHLGHEKGERAEGVGHATDHGLRLRGAIHPHRTLTQLQRVLPRGRHQQDSSLREDVRITFAAI